jgi:hypothetical protein
MKKRTKCLVCFACLLFGFSACEFSPSQIPLTEIEKPSEDNIPDIWIELTPAMDTLRLSAPAWVTYTAETGEHQVYDIKIQLDNADVGNVNYDSRNKIRAHINSDLLDDGFHELKITTYTATNSGSIADKTGNEAYWYELKWPVYVNKKAKENFQLKDLEFTPDGIKISWTQYNYADFNRYVFSSNYNFNLKNNTNITNPKQNSYIDNSYVEGIYANYSIALYYTEWGHQVDDVDYHEKIKKPEVSINEDCSVDVSWERAKNEQQVKLYCLRTSAPDYGIPEEHDLEDLNQTTLRLDEKIGFGADYQVRLRYIPTWFDSYHSALNTAGGVTTFALGDSVPRFQQAFLVPAENSFLMYNDGMFKKYSLLTGESLATASVTPTESVYLWTVTASPDGNYFGYFENHEYVIRRSSDLSVVKKMDIQAYDGYNFVLSSVSLSNNGLVGITDISSNLKIFDVGTGQKIFESHSNDYLRKVILSPDGKNLALMLNDYDMGTSLGYCNFDGTQISEIGRVNGVGKDVSEVLAVSSEAGHKLVVSRWRSMYDYNVEVRDSRTFELLYWVEIPSMFVPVAYDFSTDRVIAQHKSFPTKKYSYLFDLVTGEKNKVVQFAGKEPLVFTNGNVYSGNGRKINIDNFIIE